MIKPERIRRLNNQELGRGPIACWISRDQRVRDNWALLYARELAVSQKQPLAAVFCLVPAYLEATIRQYGFMLRGLQEMDRRLRRLDIPFFLLTGEPSKSLSQFVKRHGIAAVITDFSPLRINREWKERTAAILKVPLFEVDAHNIVPAWVASDKREYGAYTIRPRISRLLPHFMEEFPSMRGNLHSWQGSFPNNDWPRSMNGLKIDRSVGEVQGSKPGEKAARRRMGYFLSRKLPRYDDERNDPSRNGQSGLSPYLHFGQISAQRIALETMAYSSNVRAQESFLEELIIRRELADNFCLYTPYYDSVKGFPEWARRTLSNHRRDRREYLYSLVEFEQGHTHDAIWNAAQMEMVRTGRMHGYMRMYWAKKILEWSRSARQALEFAIYLNDRYQLDGRDPNGYAGITWSIGGVHDRAWAERPVFGKIRYMSGRSLSAKFDIDAYIDAHLNT